MNIILLAPPAGGKGIQSQLLTEKHKITHISTGELFRKEITLKTTLGKKIKELVAKGNLVDDELTIQLLQNRIKEKDCDNGYLLDGFPRTLNQAKQYDRLSSLLNHQLNYVFYMDIDKDTALKRILGRLVCQGCNAIYDKYNTNLGKELVCQKCRGKLIKRADDNEESFIKRFNQFIKNTKPLITYYQKKGLLHKIDATKDIESVFKQIDNIINKGCYND